MWPVTTQCLQFLINRTTVFLTYMTAIQKNIQNWKVLPANATHPAPSAMGVQLSVATGKSTNELWPQTIQIQHVRNPESLVVHASAVVLTLNTQSALCLPSYPQQMPPQPQLRFQTAGDCDCSVLTMLTVFCSHGLVTENRHWIFFCCCASHVCIKLIYH